MVSVPHAIWLPPRGGLPYSAAVQLRQELASLASSFLCGLLLLAAGACYEGPGPLEPAPGSPGGLCIEPEGACDEVFWPCEPVGRFCYDAASVCRGVLCGGHGTCSKDKTTKLPVCTCEPGYSNVEYALLCEPL